MTNEELVATLDQRFERIDQRFEGIDQRFGQLEQNIDERFKKVDELFDGLGEEFRHEIRLLGEDFKSNFGALADGIKAVDEKLERFQKENAKEHEELSQRILLVETRRR